MLGIYDNFPNVVHNIADFSTTISNKRLQVALVEALYKLNNQTLTLEEAATPSIPECRVSFEFGIAEGCEFTYIDDEERQKIQKTIEKKPFLTLDFLCLIGYHKLKDMKKTTLKSDHYIVRFIFYQTLLQMQIFHEKGLMYVSPKDLPEFFARRISAESSKKALKLQEEP
jgi:hypothetical protein